MSWPNEIVFYFLNQLRLTVIYINMYHAKINSFYFTVLANKTTFSPPENKQSEKSITIRYNPFTPASDKDRISPYNIDTTSSRQVIRVKTFINYEIISWSRTKLSQLTSWELSGDLVEILRMKGWIVRVNCLLWISVGVLRMRWGVSLYSGAGNRKINNLFGIFFLLISCKFRILQ